MLPNLFRLSSSRAGIRINIPRRIPRIKTLQTITTLAIETSCDDTSVAVLTKHHGPSSPIATLLHHTSITANNLAYRGIHPIASLDSHERTLATSIKNAIAALPLDSHGHRKPDFVSVTRGPGMRGSLNVGLNTAKGLTLAWGVPLLGVHHMQAHALTPRLVSALSSGKITPEFPFLTLLVSGGHTMLLRSGALTAHEVLVNTKDVAVGDLMDKTARTVLPEEVLAGARDTSYGPLLESFAFPHVGECASALEYNYEAPRTRKEEQRRRATLYGWALGPPLSATDSGNKSRSLEYSFCGLGSAVKRIAEARTVEGHFDVEERREMAREVMRVCFEHVAGRILLVLEDAKEKKAGEDVKSLVVSGGVAANRFLKSLLRAFLDARGYPHIELVFPPMALCTDNAAMIAWAGIEMYEAGWETNLASQSDPKWSLDDNSPGGGILAINDWQRRVDF